MKLDHEKTKIDGFWNTTFKKLVRNSDRRLDNCKILHVVLVAAIETDSRFVLQKVSNYPKKFIRHFPNKLFFYIPVVVYSALLWSLSFNLWPFWDRIGRNTPSSFTFWLLISSTSEGWKLSRCSPTRMYWVSSETLLFFRLSVDLFVFDSALTRRDGNVLDREILSSLFACFFCKVFYGEWDFIRKRLKTNAHQQYLRKVCKNM